MTGFVPVVSDVAGWVYSFAWTLSFYPQLATNWKRHRYPHYTYPYSVVGFSFDWVAYNVIGFSSYTIFNVVFYFSDSVKNEYYERHKTSHNPVKLNDVFFAVHALVLTVSQVYQAAAYERGSQRVSTFCRFVCGSCVILAVTAVFLGMIQTIAWLDVVQCFGVTKGIVTLIKYSPQALLNYRRKSTEGFAIGAVLLDFTGGILSFLQMLLDSLDTGSWSEFSGDIPKLLLAVEAIVFDIIYILQHYVLYRRPHVKKDMNEPGEGSQEAVEREPLVVVVNLEKESYGSGTTPHHGETSDKAMAMRSGETKARHRSGNPSGDELDGVLGQESEAVAGPGRI